MLRLIIIGLLIPLSAFSKIKDQLDLVLTLQAGDSVISITQLAPEKISVNLLNAEKSEKRTQECTVSSSILAKLKATAASESIPWTMADFQPETSPENAGGARNNSNQTSSSGNAGAGKTGMDTEEKISPSALSKNKFKYVSTQTIFSTYTYAIALPIALEAPDKAFALALLSLPVSFGAHYYLAWNKDYYDSHLLATSYFGANSLIFSYALPFMVMGPDYNAFRVGTFAVLGAYPLALHYGYKHGTRFQDEPGRVSLQSSFAATMGFLGFASTLLWTDLVKSPEVGLRIMVAQTLGAGIAGHYLSYHYRTQEKVPGGIGPGIGTFSLLGGMVAGSLLTSIEPNSAAAASAILLAGVGTGFIGGQKYFLTQYDNFERSAYNSLGLVAGAVTPLGLMLLNGTHTNNPEVWVWTGTGGAFAGYFLTRYFTSSLVEKPHSFSSGNGLFKSVAFNPCPIPTPETINGKRTIKFVAPIFSATF